MSVQTYNYTVFEAPSTEFLDFATHAPKVTMQAPSFPLEDDVGPRTAGNFYKTEEES
jgi:hypothetical protein